MRVGREVCFKKGIKGLVKGGIEIGGGCGKMRWGKSWEGLMGND